MRLYLIFIIPAVALSLLASVNANPLATNTSVCKSLLAKAGLPYRVSFDGYYCMHCYYNVLAIIDELQDNPRFDLAEMNVLYVSGLDGYAYHAIIEYGDFIIDPSQDSAAENKTHLYSKRIYFESIESKTTSMVRTIPALDYLAEFDQLGARYYYSGLNDPLEPSANETGLFAPSTANDRYPRQSLESYLK